LQEAIRRVSLLTDRNAQIRMLFSEGEVQLAAGATDTGNAEETIPCAFTGRDELLIAFNPGFLKDGLAVIPTDRVAFGFTEPSQRATMIPVPEQPPEPAEEGKF